MILSESFSNLSCSESAWKDPFQTPVCKIKAGIGSRGPNDIRCNNRKMNSNIGFGFSNLVSGQCGERYNTWTVFLVMIWIYFFISRQTAPRSSEANLWQRTDPRVNLVIRNSFKAACLPVTHSYKRFNYHHYYRPPRVSLYWKQCTRHYTAHQTIGLKHMLYDVM